MKRGRNGPPPKPTRAQPNREPIPTTAVRVEEPIKKRSAPKNQPSGPAKAMIFTAGLLFLGYALTKLFAPEPNLRPLSQPQSAYSSSSLEVFSEPGSPLWANPETSVLKKSFCVGNQTSSACADDGVHPFVTEFDRAGWTPDEYERYLGWDTAPNEGDDMVVEDTLIYPNKSFKLFGKN